MLKYHLLEFVVIISTKNYRNYNNQYRSNPNNRNLKL